MGTDRTQTRYAAHHALAGIGPAGQERINASKVLLVGLGGLGCPVAQYLVSSGVGELHFCDFDTVSESNLARQFLYTGDDVGRYKCDAALEYLNILNPLVGLHSHNLRADGAFLENALSSCDLVIDASDNYGTRLAINAACLGSRTPWVMGSCIRMEGQVMLFEPGSGRQPCYRCVYGDAPDTLEDCPGAGVFAPVAGIVGSLMAHVALTRLAGLDTPPGLNLLDAGNLNWRRLAVKKDPACKACGEPTGT